MRAIALSHGHSAEAITGYRRVKTVERKDTSLTAKCRRALPYVSDPALVEEEVVESSRGMPVRDLELLALGAQIQRHMVLNQGGEQ